MNIPPQVEYYFSAVHKHNQGDTHCQFSYAKVLRLTLLNQFEEAIPFYDKDLKMWFQTSDIYEKYRIEIKDADVIFDKKYKKIEDLQRRLQYVYSGIEITLKNKQTIHSIDNLGELISNWELRKQYMLKDFKGDSFMREIENINQRITNHSRCCDIFFQYQNLGLLFPPITNKLYSEYSTDRLMTIEPYYDIYIDETIKLTGTGEYVLTGKDNEKSALPLHSYEGSLNISPDMKVRKSCVKLSYGEKYINNWAFILARIV